MSNKKECNLGLQIKGFLTTEIDESSIAYCSINLETREISNLYFGSEIRSAGIHEETENILKNAIKNLNIPLDKNVLSISMDKWNDFLVTKDLEIIKNNVSQETRAFDMFDLRVGQCKEFMVTDIKYFVYTGEYQLENISRGLAMMLELVERKKLHKIKTDEINMQKLLKHLENNNLLVSCDVFYRINENSATSCKSFLEFCKLIK